MVMRIPSTVTQMLTVATLVSVPALGQAQTPATATATARSGIEQVEPRTAELLPATPIAQWRIETSERRPALKAQADASTVTPPPARRSKVKLGVKRALVGAAAGFGGFIAGGLIGARIEGTRCGCDDPGLLGFVIGAPIGAAVGAVIGVSAVK